MVILSSPELVVEPARRTRPGSAYVIVATAYLLLFLLPSELALVGPLKSNGAPVRLLGLAALLLVTTAALQWRQERAVRPVAAVLLAHLALEIAVWAASSRGGGVVGGGAFADRALLRTMAAVGLAVLCAMVVHTLARAHKVAGFLIGGAAVSAFAAILQQLGVIRTWADVITLPFTTTVVSPGGVSSRGELLRVSGSAAHPIEFAVGMAMVLPLALHLAAHAITPRGKRWSRLGLLMLAITFPMGVSRGGLVALVVALVVYGVYMSGRGRAALYAGTGIVLAASVVLLPTVVATFTEIVAGAQDDDSIRGRLGDYPMAFARIAEAPWLGGAPGDPTLRSNVLDNQWLGTLVRSGVLGVVSLVVLFLGVVIVAMAAARRTGDGASTATRSLNGAVAAGVAAAAVSAGTFDFLSFQQVTFTVFLLAGLVGVYDERADDSRADPAL